MKTMCTKVLLFLALLTSPVLLFSQDKFSRVELEGLSQNDLKPISELGIDLSCGASIDANDDGSLNLILEISNLEVEELLKIGYTPKVLINDVSTYYSTRNVADLPNAKSKIVQMEANQPITDYRVEGEQITNIGQYSGLNEINWAKPANFFPGGAMGSMGGYFTLKEIYDQLDLMRAAYPNLISVKAPTSTTHTTYLGNEVYFVRISDNPDIDEAGEPESLMNGNMHAREGMSIMNIIYHMWYVLENYATDPAIKNLVDNHELYFIPVANPDGYVWNYATNPGSGGGQRKNLRNVNLSGVTYDAANYEITSGAFTTTQGVDMNRNWGAGWAFNGNSGGSSGTTTSGTYRGPVRMSEPETQAIREFVLQHQFELCLNHHSFKDALLHAYAGAFIHLTGFEDEYYAFSQEMSRYNRYVHGSSTEISYQNAGNTNDWMLTVDADPDLGNSYPTMSWTPENGNADETSGGTYGGFWPLPSNIIPIANRAMRMNFMAHYLSGKYAKIHDITDETLSSTSGNISFSVERLGRTDSDYTLTITPKNGGISFPSTVQTITNPGILTFTDVNFAYTLPAGTAANSYIEYDIKLDNDDYTLYEATISKVFNPTVIFQDDMNVGNNGWTTNGTGGWAFNATDGFNGTRALNITPGTGADYANNASYQLQNTTNIDLSTTDKAVLTFRAKWDIERNFDYMQLQASVNGGTSWSPLVGKYTKPGSNFRSSNNSSGVKTNTDKDNQPDGEPLYDGHTRGQWMYEEIILDNYTGGSNARPGSSTVQFRFIFSSDRNNPGDAYDETANGATFAGFIFDDFTVTSLDANLLPVELSSFEASNDNNERVQLTWTTASEDNNKGFDVQHSTDGITWTAIGFVNGNGTTDSESSYRFSHNDPSIGVNYYRLKQIDEDGTFEFSDIRTVDIYSDGISVSMREGSIASIGVQDVMSFDYSVVNASGEILQSGKARDAVGFVELDLSNYANGVYYINIIEENGSFKKAFPVQKVR